MQEFAEQFHEACRQRFSNGRRRNNYPDAIKKIALQYADAARDAGVALPKIASALGITDSTLRAWQLQSLPAARRDDVPRAPVPVQVGAQRVREITSVYVVHAGPLRIECRDASAVAELVRAMT